MILAKADLSCDLPRLICDRRFKVLATVTTIINYNCTVITMVNYDRKIFIVQAPVANVIKLFLT